VRATLLMTIALALILGVAGCGRRGHTDVQRDLTEAAEKLAQVMSSNASDAEKLADVEEIAKRIKELAEEAKELGNPGKSAAVQVGKFRERDLKAAQKLLAAAGGKPAEAK